MSDVDFKLGIYENTTDVVLFVDPNDLDRNAPYSNANISVVRNAINNHQDGLGTRLGQNDIEFMIRRALNKSPSAIPNELDERFFTPSAPAGETESVCLVINQTHGRDDKLAIASATARMPSSLLKPPPGAEGVWDRAIGVHEGTHCNDTLDLSNLTHTDILLSELQGDLASVQWLKDNNHHDVAQALTDYRILGAAFDDDIRHATGFAINTNGHIQNIEDYVKAAEEVGSKMLQAVSDEHDLGSQKNALKLAGRNPGRFVRTIERAIERGEFKDENNPDLESHAQAYTQAFRRQVEGITPPVASQKNITSFNQVDINDIKGGQISVDLASGDSASMTIGEVTASDFFASFAHPELANQRIALQEAAIDPALDFSINQNNVATMSV